VSRPAAATFADPAVEITHVHKRHGPVVEVDDLSLSIAHDEIFGIIGAEAVPAKPPRSSACSGRAARTPDPSSCSAMTPHRPAGVARAGRAQLQGSAWPAKLRVDELMQLWWRAGVLRPDFLRRLWVSRAQMAAGLRQVSNYTPLGATSPTHSRTALAPH
jgi:hypothetical protein